MNVLCDSGSDGVSGRGAGATPRENNWTKVRRDQTFSFSDFLSFFDCSFFPSFRWGEIMRSSDRTVTLVDLCGHEKYLKTTVFGLTSLSPHVIDLILS